MRCIFMHIPKSGGTSIHRIIEQQYAPQSVYTIRIEGGKRTTDQLKTISARQRKNFQVVKGHEPFGLHEVLGNNWSYFTFLRDPIERTISYFHYVKRTPHHFLHQRGFDPEMSISEFLEARLSTDLDNAQLRYVSGWDPQFGACDAAMFQQALTNIKEHFFFVGTVEQFDKGIEVLAKQLKWKVKYIPQANKTENRPQQKDYSEQDLATIKAFNHWDIQLYENQKSKLEYYAALPLPEEKSSWFSRLLGK